MENSFWPNNGIESLESDIFSLDKDSQHLLIEKINLGKYKTVYKHDLESEIKDIVKQKPNLSIGAYMGLIMSKYRGKVDGKKVMQILKKLV